MLIYYAAESTGLRYAFIEEHGGLERIPMPPTLPLTDLNPAQREVSERGLLTSGFSAVLQMPTGAGKTWLAEQAIASVLEGGRRAHLPYPPPGAR